MDPLFVKAVSIGLGSLLLLAGQHKLRTAVRFRSVLRDYHVLPALLVTPAAWTIPMVELVVAGVWLFTVTGNVRASIAASATAILLALYMLAIMTNVLRGRRHISCGCSLSASVADDQTLSWWLVLRNGLLIAVALAAGLPQTARELGFVDFVTLMAALLTATLLYLAGSQLLRNSAAIGSWGQGRV